MVEQHGAARLLRATAERTPLADAMVDQRLATNANWTDPATRLTLVRETGLIIAARPPATWHDAIDRVQFRLRLTPGVLHLEVIDHSQQRAFDTPAYSEARIIEIQDSARRKLRWQIGPPGTTGTPSRPPNTDLGRRVADQGFRPHQ